MNMPAIQTVTDPLLKANPHVRTFSKTMFHGFARESYRQLWFSLIHYSAFSAAKAM